MSGNGAILIPARAGSTRVKGKNLRPLGGKPLLGHIVEAAVAADRGRVIVSTDSDEIADVAEAFGAEVPFRRPPELSTATATSVGVLLHALRWLRDHEGALPDVLAFCPPTNPFTRAETIAGTFRMLGEKQGFNSVITIYEPDVHPFSFIRRSDDGSLTIDAIHIDGKNANNVERSQDFPRFWLRSANCATTRTRFFTAKFGVALAEEGATYIQTFDVERCAGFEIPPHEACDIDTPADFERAESMIGRRSPALP